MTPLNRDTLVSQLDQLVFINTILWFYEVRNLELHRIGKILKKSFLRQKYKPVSLFDGVFQPNLLGRLQVLQEQLSNGEVIEFAVDDGEIKPLSLKIQDGDRNYHQQSFFSLVKRCKQLNLTPPECLTKYPYISIKDDSTKQVLEIIDQIKRENIPLGITIESFSGTRTIYY